MDAIHLVLPRIALLAVLAGCASSGPGTVADDLGAAPPFDVAGTDSHAVMRADLSDPADLTVEPAPDLAVRRDLAAESCAAMEARYLALVDGLVSTSCAGNADCKLVTGHCGVGLGGCYYAVNGRLNQGDLDRIALSWTQGGCEQGRPVCRCAPPPPVECAADRCRPAP